jgi:hypothetical protein
MEALEALSRSNMATPTDQQFDRVADKQKREMGGTFDQVFSPEVYGEGVRRMQRKRANLDAMMSRIKPTPWMVINLMPFPLNVNGVLHSHLVGKGGNQVPACPVGQPYEKKIIDEVLYSIKDEGAGMDNLDNYNPEPWDPAVLAADYINEFVKRMGCGGVVIYEGAEEPEKCGKMHLVEEARKERNQWLLRKVQEAEADWSDTSGRGRKNITELHRKAAEVLLHEKILKAQPAWLLATSESAGKVNEPCPGCGEVSEKDAAICKHCRYVFDPLKAYKNTMIEYGHVAMTRLSTEQWKEANQIKAEREEKKEAAEKEDSVETTPVSEPVVTQMNADLDPGAGYR